jgi:putative addiction module component (TIGR02574 family)
MLPMNATAEKITGQAMALPVKERAMLAHKLITSLDPQRDAEAKAEWEEVIDRRSRETEEGHLSSRSEEEMIGEIRAKVHARCHPPHRIKERR